MLLFVAFADGVVDELALDVLVVSGVGNEVKDAD